MSGATIESATISARLHRKNGDDRPLSAQATTKKKPQHQDRSGPGYDEIVSNLDDVIFLRLPEVKAITGLSKTSLYALIRDRSFPAPIHLGPRAVAWVRDEVRQWAVERVRVSRSVA